MSGAGLKDLRRERGRYIQARCADFGSFRSRQRRDRKMAAQLERADAHACIAYGREQTQALARHSGHANCNARAPPSRTS